MPRENLALVLPLESAGLSVEEALSPARALDQLDRMLFYHGVDYVDSLVLEIPTIKGGEVSII